MAKTTASRKAKGRVLQQYMRNLILSAFPLDTDDVRSTPMGVAGSDIQLSPKAATMLPYDFECKNQEKSTMWAAWKQLTQRKDGKKKLLVMKKNLHDPLAVVLATDLISLLAENYKLKHGSASEVSC
jgi:hypothetical protein